METVEVVVDHLDRLKRHIAALHQGQTSARDDAATVLHLLAGTGRGYGRLFDLAHQLGDDGPLLPVWADSGLIPSFGGLPLIVGLRGVADVADDDTSAQPLPVFLDEVCLRHAVPGVEPKADWTWRDIVRQVRNKFGSHADHRPPQWLRDLRYYPAADSDVVSYLMWSVGQAVLEASTKWLIGHGVDIDQHVPEHYLSGVRLHQAYVFYDETKVDFTAQIQPEKWASGRRRAIIGGMFQDKPYIFGLQPDGHLVLVEGHVNRPLRDLYEEFRTTGTRLPPNRKQRRAAAAKKKRRR